MGSQVELPQDQNSVWNLDGFFTFSADMLCIIGYDGYVKLANSAFEKTLGYTQSEVLAQSLLTFVHPDDRALTSAAIKRLTAENPSVYFVNRFRGRDNIYQYFGWTLSYNDQQSFYAVVRKISQPKASAESPFETLNNWLVDAPAGIIVLHGIEQVITLANALYEKISDHSQAQLVGRKLIDVFPELYEQGIGEIFSQIYKSGEAFVSQEFYAAFSHSDQNFLEEGYYNFVAQPVKNTRGQVTDLFIHVYEVTEYVVARQKLQESEEQFRAIFNQSTVGISETDLAGQFSLVNDRYCEIVGYSREELLRLRLFDITYPDDVPYSTQLFGELIKDGKKFVVEQRYLRKDGSTVWVNNSVSLIRDANSNVKCVVAVTFDITDVKEAEQALQEHQREQAVAQERQRLARELHDSVTQALFSAGVITEAIPRLLQAQPQKALTELDNLSEVIRGASSEMRTLLMELRPDRIIHTSLIVLLTQLAYAIHARNPMTVLFRVRGDNETLLSPPVLLAIYRIAQESINNVIKHSGASKISILVRQNKHYIMLIVKDNGQGFDTGVLRPGFGLTIMQERAEEVGAQLDLRSTAGKGTRMRLFWQGDVEAEPREITSGE